MKKIALIALALIATLTLSACGSTADSSTNTDNCMVEIKIKDSGSIKLELYPEAAPKTVANFLKLVEEKFYDGLIFHRVISGFMIQGGDPTGTGMGGSEKEIEGEFAANGFNNPIRHERGVISMARTNDPNSASSQFFIMHADYFSLDGNYAAFGKVVEGIEEVDKIAAVQTDAMDKPVEPQIIESIRVIK